MDVESPVVMSMSDESEVRRMLLTHGLGEPIFDEETDPNEMRDILRDLGVDPEHGTDSPS